MKRSLNSTPLFALVVAFLLLSPVGSQTPSGGTGSGPVQSPSGTNGSALPPASSPTGTLPSNGTLTPNTNSTNSTIPNNTTASPTPEPIFACGNAPGQFVVDKPVASSIAIVSQQLNISWHYSGLTNTSAYPRNKVSIYYQNADGANPLPTGWKLVTELNRTATMFLWNVPQLQDGNYMVRLVADDLDAQQQQGKCYPDSFPVASSSARFRINNNIPLATYTDGFGASSGGLKPLQVSFEAATTVAVTGLAGLLAAFAGLLL
ncbi:hypothetical protein HK097_009035 [Rhizophlyctis rosea]|uniref:Uncharacterized protein n=1 Tax=Rhizophlyctis rosea TaxID=64517 RepID=A0AAD5SHX3_9FUNG|nr:hypothetical protein HK097_009035 [Rhizophlyctis rosea]